MQFKARPTSKGVTSDAPAPGSAGVPPADGANRRPNLPARCRRSQALSRHLPPSSLSQHNITSHRRRPPLPSLATRYSLLTTVLLALCSLALLLTTTGCSSVRKNYPKNPSHTLAPPPASESPVTQRIDTQLARHPAGQSGFRLLALSSEALAARLALADQATRSLDVQYYMIHDDPTGRLVLQHILAAADRGVRVRILIDDIHVAGNDRDVLALNAHPNIEVRLFNPFKGRQANGLAIFAQYLLDGRRLNRRMHNKSYIADSQIAIIGGRNIGDEYFDARQDVNFRDLDVMTIGPIVREITASFDTFWNDTAAYPLDAFYLRSKSSTEKLDRYRAALQKNAAPSPATASARTRLAHTGFAIAADDEPAPNAPGKAAPPLLPAPPPASPPPAQFRWCWGTAKLIADNPDKVNPDDDNAPAPKRGPHIGDTLAAIIATTQKKFLLISPYFVPRQQGVDLLAGLTARGATVKVLTNTLAATDVPMVHAGYARYRPALLRAGVELYELRDLPSKTRKSFFRGRRNSGISLHAKAFVIDDRHTFIGSMNIDPRSELLNTEMGVLVDSPELAHDVTAFFKEATDPDSSYQVHLASNDRNCNERLYWTGAPDGAPVTLRRDPGASVWRRTKAFLMRLLPIEGLL